MQYLEDQYGHLGDMILQPPPAAADKRALVNLLVRMHDIYISSPNNTQANFCHTQGAMYLAPYATDHCAEERAIKSTEVRAKKIAEIWKQLNLLEDHLNATINTSQRKGSSYYLAGNMLTHADLTWFPTVVFMEHLLTHNFGWDVDIFHGRDSPLPLFANWYSRLDKNLKNELLRFS